MSLRDDNFLHLGADLDKIFVSKFRDYCRLNDFKQKTLVRRLVECWLALDPISQEHIYRGRLDEVFFDKAPGRAKEVVARAKAQTAKQKQKSARKPSKSA